MNPNVKRLGGICAILFVMSIFVHINEHKRGQGDIVGRDFLPGFDADKVVKVIIQDKNEKLELQRDQQTFLIENHHSYPASPEKINDLLYKISRLQIQEHVTDSKDLHQELRVSEQDHRYHISAFDKNDKKIIDFYVGKVLKNKSYLRYVGNDDVYLATDGVHLNLSPNSFINREILAVDHKKMVAVEVNGNKKFRILKKKENEYEIKGHAKLETEKILAFLRKIERLSFKDFYPLNHDKVVSLGNGKELKIQMDNQLTYKLDFYKNKDSHFIRASSHAEGPGRIVIQKNADQQEIANVEKQIQSKGLSQRFNLAHGKWVYEVSEADYKRFTEGPDL